jgi:hypothetical protein
MKLTIKSDPEIVIELDSDVQKEVIDLTPRSDVKSEPEREPEPGTKSKARQTFEKRRSMLELRQGRTPKTNLFRIETI